MHQREIIKKFMISKVLDVVETAMDNPYVDSRSRTRFETKIVEKLSLNLLKRGRCDS